MINPQDVEDFDVTKDETKNKFTSEFIDEFTDNYVEDDEYVQPQVTTTIREEK